MSTNQNDSRPARRPEGKEGAGAHQEGRESVDAGQTQRREKSELQKDQPSSVNDHQKTVSGKKQHGPDEKIGRDAGGNEGSKGRTLMLDGRGEPVSSLAILATSEAEAERSNRIVSP